MRFSPHRPDPRRAARLAATALALVVAAAVPAWGQSPNAAPASRGSTGAKVSELVKSDVKLGSGTEATAGRTVVVHYTGWLHAPDAPDGHGTRFDSSLDRGTPFSFVLGAGRVIRGWDEGVAGMKVGGKRTLVIPAHLGYGKRGAGGVIPPDATLVFDVELIEVKG
jgi:FKBP-type peptidyl-prolyl cis-trans isomerase